MLHDKKIREGRKQKYLLNGCTFRYTCPQTFITKEILMTVRVLGSRTGHVLIDSIHNYFLLLTILYSLCLQQASQLVKVLYLVECHKISFLHGLGIIRHIWIEL